MKLWAAYYYQGLELPAVPRQQVLDQLVAEVSQRYQRISSELGLARESQVRELLAAFDGQEVPGELFGQSGSLQLPTFQHVAPHETADGQTELDAVAVGDAVWVVEIKWQNQPARRADLEHFLARVQAVHPTLPRSPDALWFIARAGFREAALRFARQLRNRPRATVTCCIRPAHIGRGAWRTAGRQLPG